MIALILAPVIALAAPPPVACAPARTTQTVQTAPLKAQKLAELPDADMDLAVIRSVGGCSVREVTRFKVSERSPAGVDVALPTPGYRGALVPDGSVARTTHAGR